ncbi:hypothetical protein M9Y10_021835 [Tritrichomonas musculus]|uniref:C2H2-type domain-containing protein n=1 Tax=Tritrichomonas musculus TaxID=1915356 RepID=A0ABR2KQJ7_9EUKA
MSTIEEKSNTRYRELLLSFRITNTLELGDGRCACISCQKLFRSIEYLYLHFENHHALELQKLLQRSKHEVTSKQENLYIPRHQKISHEHNSEFDVKREDDESMNALQRAEKQIYDDLENKADTSYDN